MLCFHVPCFKLASTRLRSVRVDVFSAPRYQLILVGGAEARVRSAARVASA